MGLRFRTPIGSLREQRRRAEDQLPPQGGKTATVRYRDAESIGDGTISAVEFGKRENLIERLRSVLASERSTPDVTPTDYQVIQEELSRISHHQQANRIDGSNTLPDLHVPRNMFFDSAAPFRYVVIDGGKNSEEFAELIPKLDRAPTNLDAYVNSIRSFDEPVPRSMPLTLLLSSESEKPVLKVKNDPSQDAALLTQNNMTQLNTAKERSFLPKSLVLSLLGDK